jgi:hypothetical protein
LTSGVWPKYAGSGLKCKYFNGSLY